MFKVNDKPIRIIALMLFSVSLSYAKKTNVENLKIEPQGLETTLDQEQEFVVSGGKAPYTFKTSLGLIRYSNNTATYISPNYPGEATVTVKDALGATKTVKILVISNEKDPESQ